MCVKKIKLKENPDPLVAPSCERLGEEIEGTLTPNSTTGFSPTPEKTDMHPRPQICMTGVNSQPKPGQHIQDCQTLAGIKSEIIWTATLDGRMTYISPSVEPILGFSVEEAMSHGMLDYLVPESQAMVLRVIEEELDRDADHGLDPNRFCQIELQEFHKSGEKLWIEVFITFQRDGVGRPIGIFGVTRDITQRKQTDQMLKDSLDCYQRLFDDVADAWIVCENDRITSCNQAALEMFGVKDKLQFLRLQIWDTFPENQPTGLNSREIVQQMASSAVADGSQWFQWTHKRLNGELFPAEVLLTSIPQKGTDQLNFVIRDVSERHAAMQALKESENRNKTHIANTPIGVIEWNRNFEITAWNPAAERIFGYSAEEVIGRHSAGLLIPECAKDHVEKVWTALMEKSGGTRSNNENVRKDGEIILCDWNNTSLVDNQGNVYGVASMVTDVTEVRVANDAIKRSEKLLDAMGSVAKIGGWELDVDSMALRWTKETYRLHEVDADFKPTVESAIAFYSPEYRPFIEKAVGRAIEEGEPFDLELYLITAKGNRIAVHAVGRAVQEHGKTISVSGTFQDITQRKAAEEAQITSEQNYCLLANNVTDVIWTSDLDGNITFVSPSVLEYRGFTVEEELRQKVFDSVTPESATIAKNRLAAEIAREEDPEADPHRSATLVLEHRHKDGTTFWGEVKTTFLRDSNRKPTGLLGISRDVTKRKQVEDALAQSNGQLQAGVDCMPLAYIIWDKESRVMEWNGAAEQIFGYTKEEVIGEYAAELIVPEVALKAVGKIMSSLKAGEVVSYSEKDNNICKDGTLISCQWHNMPLEDSEGNIIGILSMAEDITERKKAEEALNDVTAGFTAATGKEFFHSLTKHIQATLNVDYVMISQISRDDPEMADTLAVCAKGEIIDNISYGLPGTPCEKVLAGTLCYHPDGVQQEFPDDKLLEEMGVNSYMGIPLWASNGEPLGLMALLHSDPFQNEGLSGSMLKIFSVRTAAELERLQAGEKTQRLVTAIDQAEENIMITSTNGDIEYVNPAFEAITGYKSAEALGKNSRILNSGEHEKSFYQNLWKTIKGGQVWKGNFINRKKDGSLFQEEATISPVFDENGLIINYVAVKRDVTKELQLEQQIRQTQKMEAIGTLAGGIAHDFNNILFAILGNADMLQEQLLEEGRDFKEISEIITAGNRAKDLVAQILAFARKTDPKRVQVDMCLLVKEVSRLIRSTFPSTIEVKTKLGITKAIVQADPTNMHQVLMNICTNARHAMLESGGKLGLSVTSKEVDEEFAKLHGLGKLGLHVVLEISDTGNGIPKQIVDRVFEPFFTTKGQNEGTGLGLSVVHGIVTDLGGQIFVYSEDGVGTTFRVYLPQVSELDGSNEPHDSAIVGGRERILVVDDEPVVANLSGKILSGLGYSVKVLTSSTEALELFNNDPNKFDLLVTDQTMPVISGDRLAIEAMKARPGLPVILCTGFSETLSSEKARQIGIQGILTKPIPKHEFANAVREALDAE